MEGALKLPLSDETLSDLVVDMKDKMLTEGVIYRTVEDPQSANVVMHAPFILLPSPFPLISYEQAQAVQQDFNLLMYTVANDHQFLADTLEKTIKVDEFTRNMWDIYMKVLEEGETQPISLALNRSDYMLDCGIPSEEVIVDPSKVKMDSVTLKQIEFNTVASSFGGLCSKVSKCHRYLLDTMQIKVHNKMPSNNCVEILAKGMVTAWDAYKNRHAAICFLVSENERNIYDQRYLEYAVKSRNPQIKVIRRSLQQVGATGRINSNKALVIGKIEVAIVYFRMCYSPEDYKGSEDWDTRLMIERSNAIKCPNISYHLAGTKKVQQVLAQPGVVERFMTDSNAAGRIRKTFTGQYTLDRDAFGNAAIDMALKEPHKFVLKPQREGGGNNIFGNDIPKLLSKIENTDERMAYILMQRIFPMPLNNYVVTSGSEVKYCPMVSELGIFGVTVATANRVLLNTSGGHILRTKSIGTDEGGVATGYAALDSPFLI